MTTVLIGPVGTSSSWWDTTGVSGIRFDYPGHGGRAHRPGWSVEDVLAEITAGSEPIDVVGVGTGALLAVTALVRRPDRVRSAVLICADLTGAELPNEVPTVDSDAGSVIAGLVQRWFSRHDIRTEALGVRHVRDSWTATDPAALADAIAAVRGAAPVTAADLHGAGRPVTLVAGTHDAVLGVAWAQDWHEAIDSSRVELWQGSHALPWQRPEGFQLIVDRHAVWAPYGTRIEETFTCGVWLASADLPTGDVA